MPKNAEHQDLTFTPRDVQTGSFAISKADQDRTVQINSNRPSLKGVVSVEGVKPKSVEAGAKAMNLPPDPAGLKRYTEVYRMGKSLGEK